MLLARRPLLRCLHTTVCASSLSSWFSTKVEDPPHLKGIFMTAVTERTTISKWLVSTGEKVKEKTALAEMENKDYVYDFLSPINGFVAEIKKKEKESVETGELLVLVAESLEAADLHIKLVNETKEKTKIIPKPKPKIINEEKEETKINNENENTNLNEVDTEVKKWLRDLHVEYVDLYAEILNKEGFDSLDAVKTLTQADLEKMGVKKGHQRVILSKIAEIKL